MAAAVRPADEDDGLRVFSGCERMDGAKIIRSGGLVSHGTLVVQRNPSEPARVGLGIF